MYRATSTQTSFLEPSYLTSWCLPEDDWSYIFRNKIWDQIDEELFKSFYDAEIGAPNKSVKVQVAILIFMALENLTWREAEFQYSRRIDWLNATRGSFGDQAPDHTTLFKFFRKLEQEAKAYQLFSDLTNLFIRECNVSTAKQRTDSFFMLGWLEILSRYGLLKETIRSFLQTLRKHQVEAYNLIKDELDRDYLKEDFDLTEKDREKAQRRVKNMAEDLYRLKQAFENHPQIKTYDTYKTLVTVFEQQCEIKGAEFKSPVKIDDTNEVVKTQPGSGKKESENLPSPKIEPAESPINTPDIDSAVVNQNDVAVTSIAKEDKPDFPSIEIREKPVGEKIISSPHNTDAEYTRKRKQTVVGHKAFVTETCDPENKVQFITDVNLVGARHNDAAELEKIESRLEEGNRKPKELAGDAGFVNGETILQSEKREIELVGPSSGRSQSFEKYHDKLRPLDGADFKIEINPDTKELEVEACPAGKCPLSQTRSEKTGKIIVHFEQKECSLCALKDRCPVKIGVTTSTFNVDETQYAGALRHHLYMNDPGYRKRCAVRAGAESLVNEVANTHGARKSKHKTEVRSKIQLIFAAISCNVKRYIKYSQTLDQGLTQPA